MSELQEPAPDVQSMLSVIILQNQRIYDVLLSILGEQSADACYNLIEIHKQLDNVGPVPYKVNEDD